MTCVPDACIKGRDNQLDPTDTLWYDYLSLTLVPDSGWQVLRYDGNQHRLYCTVYNTVKPVGNDHLYNKIYYL